MTPQLLDYVRLLSSRDRKNLSQKTLKTTEEVGELAKKVLPFENAHSTTHRFVERRDVLEECIDTILCALSIGYSLGFSDEDVNDMLFLKANKWASLQEREEGMSGPLPFELHVTVHAAPSAEVFRQACQKLGVKPIFLALQNTSGETVLHDVMTSSVHLGCNRTAAEELERIVGGLTAEGFQVVRRKVETVPWHPAAPSRKNGTSHMPAGCYFESHVGVLVEGSTPEELEARREALRRVTTEHGAHLSRNVFKQLTPTAYTLMVTLRDYDTSRELFESERDDLVADLLQAGFRTDKVITEFSVFDSKTGHDGAWLKAD